MGIESASQHSNETLAHNKNNEDEAAAAAAGGDRILDSHRAWLAKHPCALGAFERMIAAAKGKTVVVFLDYDGTLSPIVDDPHQAFMSDSMRSVVHQVAHFLPTAIVSGRCLDKVIGFVQLKNVVYAGSHGMDILTPAATSFKQNNQNPFETTTVDEQGNEIVHFQPAQEFLPEIRQMIRLLEEKVKTIKGAMVEDNKFCISVHFRRVAHEEDVSTLHEMVKAIVKAYPNFGISGGKKVMEIRPCIDWDKGRALEYLLDKFGFNSSRDFLPVYIGDDKTDEDAFKVIRRMGRGFPIIVSSHPRETMALYSLCDPDEVMSFLQRLARWKKRAIN